VKAKSLYFVLGWLLTLHGVALAEEKSVIIGFKHVPGRAEEKLIRNAKGKVHRSHQLIPAMTVSLPEEAIAQLKKHNLVAYVERNAVYRLPVAPAAASSATSTELNNSWGVKHIFADVAHAAGNKGTGIKVAILDTGIDYNHPDLAENYLGGHDFVFNDDDPLDDSDISHGTNVAGIIAARENGAGVVGVAPEAKLLAVKVLDGGGFGTVDWIIAGIDWSVANGAQVINMSFQGSDNQALQEACDKARAAGVLLVAAGGNSATGGQPLKYPAAYESVIAVTATDVSDKPAYFDPLDPKLELAAPGVDIYSTARGGGYTKLSGTSQAAPHVAGAAALYLHSNTKDVNMDGHVDSEDVRLLLQATAVDLGNPGRDPTFGFGLVNAGLALPASDKDKDKDKDNCHRRNRGKPKSKPQDKEQGKIIAHPVR
jgi:subtilisin